MNSLLCRQNQTQEQKVADVERRSKKRAAEKEERAAKKLAQTNEDWVIQFINNLALDIPEKSEKQKSRLAKQRIRQQNLRDAWTPQERSTYNTNKNEYQRKVREAKQASNQKPKRQKNTK